jgi:N-acyl-L-homoserine lactone synthetase
MVFGFELDSELIGTIRIVPLGFQLTLAELLLKHLGQGGPAMEHGRWEVGRLVLAPEFRSDVDALRHCLFLALSYACQHTRVTGLYAACTHVLSRLYRRFGFLVHAREVPLAGTAKAYTLIHGGGPQVMAALSGKSAGTQ